MKSHIEMSKYLQAVKDFQNKVPSAHVGGSIGLYLHGIDLKRDLSQSDIDMTIEEYIPEEVTLEGYQETSNPDDFDHQFRFDIPNDNRYIKVDVRVSPEPSFEIIERDGVSYNVSKKRDILFWKKKYADKGVQKHIDDLVVINGGERPLLKVFAITDDLPF